MTLWKEAELEELEERVALAELLRYHNLIKSYVENASKENPYHKLPEIDSTAAYLLKAAAKHNINIAAHARKAMHDLRLRTGFITPKIVPFMVKEEDDIIRATLNIETAILILTEHHDYFNNMLVQHESQAGVPRRGGYTFPVLLRQAAYIVSETEKIINAIRSLINLEKDIKERSLR